ncbi:hypothetical protein GRJ2_001599600 [Grus japonensis]|uniref:Uncharacterized protein n=1 Tax=Grus japonensis TaxID=30415 RepID=A0ABC9X0Z2_GRUJA
MRSSRRGGLRTGGAGGADLKQLSVMIKAIFTDGLTLCPCCTNFESTENESSALKRMELKYGYTLTKELE